MLPLRLVERFECFKRLSLPRVLDKEPGKSLRFRLDWVDAGLFAGQADDPLVIIFEHLKRVDGRRFPHKGLVLLFGKSKADVWASANGQNPEFPETRRPVGPVLLLLVPS